MKIKNKKIVITGATGGIGREITKELDRLGANLVLISRSEEKLKDFVAELNGNHHYFACDFSNLEETEKVVSQISEEFKNVDILINAAGVGFYKPIEEATLDEWKQTMDIGVTSQFLFIKGLVENLKSKEGSLVVNIGSGAGVIPMAGRSVYCASKFAVRGMTLSLAEEFRGTHTHFCLISLGSTLTSFGSMSFEEKKEEMESGKAYLTPDWVAKKIVEIIEDDGRDVEYRLYPSDYTSTWERLS